MRPSAFQLVAVAPRKPPIRPPGSVLCCPESSHRRPHKTILELRCRRTPSSPSVRPDLRQLQARQPRLSGLGPATARRRKPPTSSPGSGEERGRGRGERAGRGERERQRQEGAREQCRSELGGAGEKAGRARPAACGSAPFLLRPRLQVPSPAQAPAKFYSLRPAPGVSEGLGAIGPLCAPCGGDQGDVHPRPRGSGALALPHLQIAPGSC